jgi:hypothetical protein
MTADPTDVSRRIPGYRKGITKFGEWQKLMQEKPNPRPCIHPFDKAGVNVTGCLGLHGTVIVHTYACPACGELVDTTHTPLKEILR